MGPAQVTVSAGTAFKAGFFGFLGALVAAAIVGALVSCVFAIISAVFIGTLFGSS